MEENKNNIEKLNNAAEDLPEVKRLPDGTIDIEAISTGKDEAGNYIVPDEVLEKYYKELPHNTKNESGTAWSASKGILRMPDKEVQRKGAEALNARVTQRKTNKEIIDILLTRKAPKEAIERLGLSEDATMIEAANLAQLIEAMKGNTKAMEYIRDTAGEKPTEKIDASLSAMTPEQQKILEDIKAFNSNT